MGTRVKGRADLILEQFGSRVVDLAKINLGASYTERGANGRTYRKRIDSSGTLRRSVGYELNMRSEDGRFTQGNIVFSMAKHGIWVDQGRKPGKGIPQKPLMDWIKKKPLRIRDLETGAFVKATDARIKSMAFLISRNAKRKGIKPTNFFTQPFESEYEKLGAALASAVGDDYINGVSQRIDEMNRR